MQLLCALGPLRGLARDTDWAMQDPLQGEACDSYRGVRRRVWLTLEWDGWEVRPVQSEAGKVDTWALGQRDLAGNGMRGSLR